MIVKALLCNKLIYAKLCAHTTSNQGETVPVTCGQLFALPCVGPPPLISVPQQIMNPFYLKKLTGNIWVCQGCRGSLWLADGRIPDPPYSFVVARLEKRPFRDQSGTLKTPSRPAAVHYHARLPCVHAGDSSFVPTALLVPTDVAVMLSSEHLQLLQLERGLQIPKYSAY